MTKATTPPERSEAEVKQEIMRWISRDKNIGSLVRMFTGKVRASAPLTTLAIVAMAYSSPSNSNARRGLSVLSKPSRSLKSNLSEARRLSLTPTPRQRQHLNQPATATRSNRSTCRL